MDLRLQQVCTVVNISAFVSHYTHSLLPPTDVYVSALFSHWMLDADLFLIQYALSVMAADESVALLLEYYGINRWIARPKLGAPAPPPLTKEETVLMAGNVFVCEIFFVYVCVSLRVFYYVCVFFYIRLTLMHCRFHFTVSVRCLSRCSIE